MNNVRPISPNIKGVSRNPLRVLKGGMGELGEYERWLRLRGLAGSTIQQRVKFARLRLEEWGTWERSTVELMEWLDGYDGWTRWTYHSAAVSLYAWLTESGQCERSPMDGVRRNKCPKPRPNPLTPAESAAAVAAAQGRLQAFLLLGLYAGLRAHEIAKFHGQDINPSTIYVIGKGGQGAAVPTHPILWELAQEYPRDGYWFPSPVRRREYVSTALVTQSVADHFRTLGMDGSVHRTRSTYATNLLRAGVNLRIIQDLLRHDNLSSTQHYLGVSDDERMDAILRLAG